MDKGKLLHQDERLGLVAVDMSLLTATQVSDIRLFIIRESSVSGSRKSFAETAVDLGYLKPEQLEGLELEERRRRRLINGYEIIDIIGAGNVATVYHALQLAMDREVALKILHSRLASDPEFVKAYIAEAQAVSRFHHPNIVQGYDAGESNGFYYFAHEYLAGGSMSDRLAHHTANFSENRLLMYLRQTTSALKHAWAVAVYHGDINPGNLLLDDQKNIKLANLGVPRVAEVRSSGVGAPVPGFVRNGPEYAAPEQLDKPELVNALTDMYNLGATFYHISFGVPPFQGADRESITAARRVNPMPSFSLKTQEGFSGKYLRLIHDMLDPDPDQRPADPEELADRLEKFHIADADELGTLARQVRQVAVPKSDSSRRHYPSARVRSPNPHGATRVFSLSARRQGDIIRRPTNWLLAVLAAVAAAALALLYWQW